MSAIKQLFPSETQECKSFWLWAQMHPKIRDYLIKNTNEGKRSARYGHELKTIGLRPGLPDYHLPFANSKYHGLWIEMKRANAKNHKTNALQDEWIFRLNNIGHYACYAYGWEQASQIVKDYLNNKV